MEFPEDEGGMRRHPRDEVEFGGHDEDRFFREREFGRPRNFDDGRRFPDDRRPPAEWEHEDPFHPAFRFLLLLIITPTSIHLTCPNSLNPILSPPGFLNSLLVSLFPLSLTM